MSASSNVLVVATLSAIVLRPAAVGSEPPYDVLQ
jgi:hypothetical protein